MQEINETEEKGKSKVFKIVVHSTPTPTPQKGFTTIIISLHKFLVAHQILVVGKVTKF